LKGNNRHLLRVVAWQLLAATVGCGFSDESNLFVAQNCFPECQERSAAAAAASLPYYNLSPFKPLNMNFKKRISIIKLTQMLLLFCTLHIAAAAA